ncbi:type II toxin-antitoxin system HicA family toxin [Rhodothermus marinus]|uniref:type II toxin-antitoxin system HicA family toxin n=1 Tax=Rhodothermus marinus TaxID=29549 RepID=UPI0018D5F61A
MTRQPRLKGNELIAALRKAGFEVVRIKGSHRFLRHPRRTLQGRPRPSWGNYWSRSALKNPSRLRVIPRRPTTTIVTNSWWCGTPEKAGPVRDRPFPVVWIACVQEVGC